MIWTVIALVAVIALAWRATYLYDDYRAQRAVEMRERELAFEAARERAQSAKQMEQEAWDRLMQTPRRIQPDPHRAPFQRQPTPQELQEEIQRILAEMKEKDNGS